VSGRVIYVRAVPELARVRVTYSSDWQEYTARLTAPDGAIVGEYFTDNRADAVATADAMLRDHARMLGAD